MKVVGLVGSVFGTKTRIAMETIAPLFSEGTEFELIDLKDYSLEFSDGRDYRDYEGDTRLVIDALMQADAILVGTPIYQSSIPGALKNVFDLLPIDSLKDTIVGIMVTAGSSRHYLVAEYQLKPILNYMKAQVIDKYVFIEGRDFYQEAITEDDVLFRLKRLARSIEEQGVIRANRIKEKEALYDF